MICYSVIKYSSVDVRLICAPIVLPHSEVLTQTVNNFATRTGTGLKLEPFKSYH